MNEHNKKLNLLDMSDKELQNRYREACVHVQFFSNDYYVEIERRSRENHSKAMRFLTWVIVFSTLLSTIATLLNLLLLRNNKVL